MKPASPLEQVTQRSKEILIEWGVENTPNYQLTPLADPLKRNILLPTVNLILPIQAEEVLYGVANIKNITNNYFVERIERYYGEKEVFEKVTNIVSSSAFVLTLDYEPFPFDGELQQHALQGAIECRKYYEEKRYNVKPRMGFIPVTRVPLALRYLYRL